MYAIGISSGIKHGHHDGAAVLLRDAELIPAAEEERPVPVERQQEPDSSGRHRAEHHERRAAAGLQRQSRQIEAACLQPKGTAAQRPGWFQSGNCRSAA